MHRPYADAVIGTRKRFGQCGESDGVAVDVHILACMKVVHVDLASKGPRHAFTSYNTILFKLVHEKWCHLVRVARQLRSWWLRIKPCTHRVVHVNALQRIRVLLVTSLAALLHHGVAVLSGFEDAKLLGRIYLALRHELGTWLHGYAMDWRIQGWTHLAPFTVCVRLF